MLIVPFCEDYEYIFKVYNTLKKNNIKVDICYLDKGFKQKMKYANKINAKYVILIGEDEIKENVISLKNMVTGEQEKLTIKDLLEKKL